MRTKTFLHKCVRCNQKYESGLYLSCNACGGVVDPIYDLETARIDDGPTSMHKYFDLLPLEHEGSIVSLNEGQTETLHAQSLGKRLGMNALYLKNETLNPTRTTKDRMAACTLSLFKELGINEFVASSTGNSSSSFSYGIAKAGNFKIHLFAGVDFIGRHSHVEDTNVRMHAVEGDFGAAQGAARKYAIANNLVFEGGFFNPGRREGLKLAYLEAYDQMPIKPEVVVQAISSGMGIYGAHKGAQEFLGLGRLEHMPRFVCVQQKTCSPMVHAYDEGSEVIRPHHIVDNPTGIAQAILRGDPTNTYPYMRDIVLESNGTFVKVTADDMRQARKYLFHDEGIEVEYSAAAAVAAIQVMRKSGWLDGTEVTLVNLTGNNAASVADENTLTYEKGAA